MQPVAAAAPTPQQQHALLFKPDGVLSQFVQNEALCHPGHLLLSDLQSTASLPLGTMAIGRLDQELVATAEARRYRYHHSHLAWQYLRENRSRAERDAAIEAAR